MKYKQVLFGVFICIVAQFIIYQINNKYELWSPFFVTTKNFSSEIRENHGVLTNPLLECTSADQSYTGRELSISKVNLVNYIDDLLESKKASSISVYVRDLNNGPWIGINEKEEFIGASLLKVPVLMGYMKLAETDPSVLSSTFEYKNKIDNDIQYFKPEKEMELGKTYTVEQLLEYMVIYSDNNAGSYLARGLNENQISNVFSSVGLGTPVYASEYPVNTKTYAGFFRVMFNASFLNKEYSEKTLEIFTKTQFKKGLTKYLPQDLVVAHKFGIRESAGVKQLHDCGIIYYPKHPYLICIMTKGNDYEKLSGVIADISKYVYDEINSSEL